MELSFTLIYSAFLMTSLLADYLAKSPDLESLMLVRQMPKLLMIFTILVGMKSSKKDPQLVLFVMKQHDYHVRL